MFLQSRLGTASGRAMTSAGFVSGNTGRVNNALKVQTGEFTTTIYGLIEQQKYEQVKIILQNQLEIFPNSRAALSLLGYCHYMLQDFQSAITIYEQLMKICPEIEEYKFYFAQCLYKGGLYIEAKRACSSISSPEFSQRVEKLLAAIQYEQDDLAATKMHIEKCLPDDPDTLVMQGCTLFKEGNFDEARKKFQDALNITGYHSHIAYNIALCYYCMKQYTPSLKYMQEIIERGIHSHPELSVGSNTDGFEVRSVGNSQILRDTALIEAFNLKCAIYYQMRNFETAYEAIKDMPPRSESELDAVTLHNQALLQMELNPTAGFKKLRYLLQTPPFPPETYSNLLLLYCKNQFYNLAADILAENSHLSDKFLPPDLYDYIEAVIEAQTSPAEAFYKFDQLASRHIDLLRKLTKTIQDARISKNSELVRAALEDYGEALEAYIPVLMGMSKIYWEMENYQMVEKVLMQSSEFCSEHDTWKLNLAHCYFMQEEKKFKEAIALYFPIVNKQKDALLDIPAMVLANLCVSYIMTSQNEAAEELMRSIEKEEEKRMRMDPEKQCLHLCIVNLVIGTLYSSKGHYEFGISRVIKSLEPYNKKIMTDTWFYAKRCFLSLAECLAKHMIVIKDETYRDILKFLDAACIFGKTVVTNFDQILQAQISNQHNTMNVYNQFGTHDKHALYGSVKYSSSNINETVHNEEGRVDEPERRTVSYEARMLKLLFLKLRNNEF